MKISHPEDIIYPQSNIAKKEVVAYYRSIAPYLINHATNRPLVMHRFPGTIEEKGFYHKNTPDFFPPHIKRATVRLKKGGAQDLITIDSAADLAYLANQRVVSLHSWLSTVEDISRPDKIVFDLDPHGTASRHLKEACLVIKKHLENMGLKPLVMTTGAHGYHVVAFIQPKHSFDQVHDWAKRFAQEVSHLYPEVFTVEMSKRRRKNRIFVDYLRNSYGQTSIAPYSLRAHKGAPVACPITWEELIDPKLAPDTYNLKNIKKKLKKDGDAWKNWKKYRTPLNLT